VSSDHRHGPEEPGKAAEIAAGIAESVVTLRREAARALVMASWYPEASAGRTCLEASAKTLTGEADALEAPPPHGYES
jgi:hypothetical protein